MGGGCDIHFPDALNNIQPITWSLSISNSYTVPSGKNLYITSTSGNGSYGIYVNGIHIHIGNEIGDENYLIFSEGDVLTNYANGTSNYLNFNGYLVNKNVQPITWSLSISNSYTVPSGKNLYITSTSGNGSYGIYVNGIHIHIGNEIGDENYLIFSEGDVLTNYANGTSNYLNFNGYLADENYFANCGGGGSANSASNATIDSLTQVVSNIDSALNALTSLFVFGCTDITALNYDPSANWDDGSCDYNPQVAIGDEYQGGIIFHIFEQGDLEYVEGEFHGLIAAPMDQSSASKWGCNGTNISGADGIYIGTGNQNTIDIWNNPCLAGNDAAEICYNLSLNGYDDWFLPSKDELDKLFLNLDSQGLGDLYNSYYWSSSEFSSNQAWVRNPAGLSTGYKNYSGYYVRAIRAF